MKEALNQRISAIPPSASLSITAKAKALKAEGKQVCSLAAGEPDFDTPEHIKKAAAEALAAGETKYSPAVGLPALKEAICEKLQNENGLSYDTAQVIVSDGAKHSLFNVFMALLREGEEVIIPSPFWLSYPEMVAIAGGQAKILKGEEANGFKITAEDLEAAITSRTKAVVINSPSNPSGIVYTPDELKALAEVAVKHNVYIISDEIYEKVLYEDAVHQSVGSFSDEILEMTITVNGFSKAFSMTGWRLGYAAVPGFLAKAIGALQSHSTSGPNTFAQYGGVAALKGGDDDCAKMVTAFAERRDYLHGRLCDINGVSCVKPMGAFYMLPNISRFGLDSVAFAERLLTEKHVAVVPGVAFGAPEHVRLSYACSMDELRESMDRLESFVASL